MAGYVMQHCLYKNLSLSYYVYLMSIKWNGISKFKVDKVSISPTIYELLFSPISLRQTIQLRPDIIYGWPLITYFFKFIAPMTQEDKILEQMFQTWKNWDCHRFVMATWPIWIFNVTSNVFFFFFILEQIEEKLK